MKAPRLSPAAARAAVLLVFGINASIAAVAAPWSVAGVALGIGGALSIGLAVVNLVQAAVHEMHRHLLKGIVARVEIHEPTFTQTTEPPGPHVV